jgi:hypothetical protein
LPIKTTRVEKAIAEDVAFLAAHPTRCSGEHAMIHQKVKAAMRQRIRDGAASCGLSKPAGGESAAPRRR